MARQTLAITWISLGAFAVACNQQPTTSQQLDKVANESRDAAQDMKDYTYAQKSEFVTKMQAQLNALQNDLDKLSAKIESSSDAAKTEARPKLQALRDQSSQLNKQLEKVKDATESTW